MPVRPADRVARWDSVTVPELRRRGGLKWAAAGEHDLPAWVAEMDLGAAECVRSALHDLVDRAEFGYVAPRRTAELVEAVVGWYREECGFSFDPAAVRVTSDVVECFRVAVRAFTPPGSPVVLPVPAYPPFAATAGEHGRDVLAVPMTADATGRPRLDLAGIDAALAAGGRLVVLANPHNPTGRSVTAAELHALAEVVERHGARVFADEIHAPLTFDGRRHVPYASVSAAAARHALTAFSPSKAFNLASLKTAALVLGSPDDVAVWDSLGPLASHGASIAGLVAATAALREGRDWFADALGYLQDNRDRTVEVLNALDGVAVRSPEATYLAWVDLTGTGWSRPAEHLAAHGLVVNDGATFGADYSRFVRVNFATPRPVLEEVLDRFRAAVACGRRLPA